jgi:DNA-3-methyladenine glycosylase
MKPDVGQLKPEGWQQPLASSWFERPATEVAPDLLGRLLVRQVGDEVAAGWIVETEAYHGENDLGCHARAGMTERTRIMYGNPGKAYIYFTYGMHWLLNAVCMPSGFPAAVLIRAIQPAFGEEWMQVRRPKRAKGWLDGPAKLCQALEIDSRLNGCDLGLHTSGLWIAQVGRPGLDMTIGKTPRIGLNSVPEPWRSMPWRFTLGQ